ncbi:MAG: GDSL-type esterase/lipase family protein [Acutalibacteraceae bacterium]
MMQERYNYDRYNVSRDRKRKHKRHKKYLVFLVIAGLIVVAISGYAIQSIGTSASDSNNSNLTPITPVQQSESTTENKDAEDTNKEPTIENGYDYTKPVPKSDMVENSYFDDAVFIGDSRTEGLILYTGLSNAISYTHKGLMVDTVFTSPVINKNGEKISVMDALRQTDFSKVYIMLGINETGWPYNNIFIEKYGKIIDEIKAINPQAIIYVQEILPVTNSVSQTHSYIKNKKINEFNVLIRQMAKEKQIYYIDTGSAVSDANGCLPEDAAIDGIHLKQSYCKKWLDYLKTHTITDIER